MADFIRRTLGSPALAWALLGLLAVVFVLFLTGRLDLSLGHFIGGESDYVAASEALVNADRSQPPHMKLESQYPGPLKDTIVQRWRDPVDGTVCYIYLPIAVEHSDGPEGLVQYGSANIGAMSCFPTRAH